MTEYLAGTLAGALQAIAAHPFDTLKTVSQANHAPKWTIKGLYRGLTGPMLTNGLISSATFGTYYTLKKNDCSFLISCVASGIMAGMVCGPVELYKIRKQVPNKYGKFRFNLGMGLSILRETPSMFTYYGSYQFLTESKYQWHPALAGGIAGVISWVPFYPIDVIKTRIQSESCKTIQEAIKLGKLLKGVSFCVLRAFPHNAVGFWGFHFFNNQINELI